MESRAEYQRALVTLTLNPGDFGAVVIGKSLWEGGKETNLWSEPSRRQFAEAVKAMSREFKRLLERLNKALLRAGCVKLGYFRVIELHRNGWPHYHVIFEHPEVGADWLGERVASWALGIVDCRPVSGIDAAIAEVAPYLVSTEKGKGSKAYQFAATALPKHFRLYSASEGFLVAPEASEACDPVQWALVVRGHFTGHHETVRAWGGQSMLALKPPGDLHRPPSTAVATGDGAVLYFTQLVERHELRAPGGWFRQVMGVIDRLSEGRRRHGSEAEEAARG